MYNRWPAGQQPKDGDDISNHFDIDDDVNDGRVDDADGDDDDGVCLLENI